MSSWANVSSAIAGAIVVSLAALLPHLIAAAERWLDARRDGNPSEPEPPTASSA